jgi:hypothetical protein
VGFAAAIERAGNHGAVTECPIVAKLALDIAGVERPPQSEVILANLSDRLDG